MNAAPTRAAPTSGCDGHPFQLLGLAECHAYVILPLSQLRDVDPLAQERRVR